MAETATSSSSAYPPRGLKPILCVAKSATPRVFLSLSEAHTMWVMQALPPGRGGFSLYSFKQALALLSFTSNVPVSLVQVEG